MVNNYPNVSVLLPTFNVEKTIEQVLRSLFNLNYPGDKFEVILIDAFSKDKTIEIAKKFPLKIIQLDANPAKSYNFVLKETKGEYIAFADGDAIVDREWLKILVQNFNDEKIAGVGGLCLTWNKENLLPKLIGYELQYRYENLPREIPRIATMNVIYRKDILEKIGGFDDELPIAYDTEIGYKVRRAGYKIIFDRNAIVYHYNRDSLKSYYKQQYNYGKNVPTAYIKNAEFAKGDEITNFWMNIQPFIISIFLLSLLLGIFVNNFFYVISGILIILLTIYYLKKSLEIMFAYKDITALFLVLIFFIRSIAWTHGGFVSFMNILKSKLINDHN